MSEAPISRSRRDQLLETAAEWVVRLQDGELSAETLDHWQRWLEASAEHQQAFDDVQRLWGRLGDIPHVPDLPSGRVLARDRYRGRERVRRWRDQLTAPPWWQHWRLAATALILFGGAVALWQAPWPEHDADYQYQTVTAQHQTVTLPDGSTLELGASSAVDVHYSDMERRVELLDGIAFFEVTKDVNRPFMVHAGGGVVTAIGTAFSVQRRDNDITVIVSEGLVEVTKPVTSAKPVDDYRQPSVVQLPAGQRVAFSTGEGLELPQPTDVAAATAWRGGRLVFQDETLGVAIADVNRYSRVPIVIDDPALNELRLTGYVVTDQLEGWLDGLETVLPVIVTQHADRVVLSARDNVQP